MSIDFIKFAYFEKICCYFFMGIEIPISSLFGFGKANAVMLVCKNTADSDAFATSFCNKIKQKEDIAPVLNEIKQYPDILSALIICKDKIGASSQFKLKVLS
jgi:uncharacterized protein